MEPANTSPLPLPAEQPKPRKRGTNVPIPIVVGIICLGLGIAGGILLAEFVTEKNATAKNADDGSGMDEYKQKLAAPGGGKGGPGGGKGGFGVKGGKGGKGGPGGGGGGGGGGFSKIQLTQLVSELHTLSVKPSAFPFSPDEKKQLAGELAGLESKEALTNEEAQAKLAAITKLLEPHRRQLQNAGFLWPGPPPTPPDPNNNPLKGSGRLKELQSTLGK